MFVWCAVLFLLGLMAFADAVFNMGEIFRYMNSVIFMLIALGLLVRTTAKRKERRTENMEARIFSLEQQVSVLRSGHEKLERY